MESPSQVEQILQNQFNPKATSRSSVGGLSEKRFEYHIEVDSYMTFDHVKSRMSHVSNLADIKISPKIVKPVLRRTDNSIESRLCIVVEELENRIERENRCLNQFEA